MSESNDFEEMEKHIHELLSGKYKDSITNKKFKKNY
jgi:hypothetical protein